MDHPVSALTWIILFTLAGGALSVLAAGLFLALPESRRARLLPWAVSFAVGALLGAAFLALLPHALEAPGVDTHVLTGVVLIGLLSFFVLEKLVLWRHCHAHDCESHSPAPSHGRAAAAGVLILVGDAIHNLVDGVLIAAAFLTDIHLGIVTGLAVMAHEIPQEVGDFAILLHSGMSRGRALAFNVLTSLTTVIGGVAAWASLSATERAVPYVLAMATASFIYIAVADLIPGLHQRLEPRAAVAQFVLIVAGVAVIYGLHATLH